MSFRVSCVQRLRGPSQVLRWRLFTFETRVVRRLRRFSKSNRSFCQGRGLFARRRRLPLRGLREELGSSGPASHRHNNDGKGRTTTRPSEARKNVSSISLGMFKVSSCGRHSGCMARTSCQEASMPSLAAPINLDYIIKNGAARREKASAALLCDNEKTNAEVVGRIQVSNSCGQNGVFPSFFIA